MCIDAKTSMQTFLIGGISGVLLSKYKKYKYLSVLVISIAFMQLAEYFMWIDINCKNNLNKLGNIIGILSLTAQMLHVAIANKKLAKIDIVTILVMTIVLVRYIYNKLPCSIESHYKHLRWGLLKNANNKIENFVFVVYFLFTLFLINPKNNSIFVFEKLLFLILLIYSVNIVGLNISAGGWESFWCYISNIVGPILLIKEWISQYL